MTSRASSGSCTMTPSWTPWFGNGVWPTHTSQVTALLMVIIHDNLHGPHVQHAIVSAYAYRLVRLPNLLTCISSLAGKCRSDGTFADIADMHDIVLLILCQLCRTGTPLTGRLQHQHTITPKSSMTIKPKTLKPYPPLFLAPTPLPSCSTDAWLCGRREGFSCPAGKGPAAHHVAQQQAQHSRVGPGPTPPHPHPHPPPLHPG